MQHPMFANPTTRRIGVGLSALLLLVLLIAPFVAVPSTPVVQAATIEVTNGDDSGPGSLRQATADAAAGDTITFAPGVTTVTLTSDQLSISNDLTIDGGAGVTVERSDETGTPDFRIFNITGGNVTLDSLTIRNGNSASSSGGGIFNLGGTVTITDSTISDNSNGGIYNEGTVTVTNSTINGNSADFQGGGILNLLGGTVMVTDSTISGNTAGGSGGGIENDGGAVEVTNSTISGNSADDGGGIYNRGNTLTIENSTISGNSATSGNGGGIFNNFGVTLTIENSTISDNSASGNGGGISNGNAITLTNTIVANSTGGGDYSGTAPTLQGSNIIEDGSVAGATAADPLLGPLQDNGGPTLTHLPLAGSPAIDAGDNAVASALTTDQRGFARQIDGGTSNTVDIGAVEVQDTCFATADGGTTIESSINADAFRTALTSAGSGGTVDVAGFCGGATVAGGGTDNVAVISDPVTVQGGYPVNVTQTSTTPDFSATPDPDTNDTVLSGQQTGRVLYVNNSTGTVSLDGLTIREGNSIGNDGGGISSLGALEVSDSTISGNSADFGGGGILNSGTLTVADSTISSNTANGASGGGIRNDGSGEVTVENSIISNNTTSNSGGGISSFGGTLTVADSTINDNFASGDGGGIVNDFDGTVEVTASTISGNVADNAGGGISSASGTATITDSTISGNSATGFGGGGILNSSTLTMTTSTISDNTATTGGGILNSSTLTVTNSTISGNSADNGGGINNSETLTLANTIVANSTSGGDYDGDAPTLEGSNIVEDGSVTGANVINADPNLGPLQNNGGPTLTHLPLAGSPAINTGDNTVATDAGLTTDQRGETRIVDGTVDIGAVEEQNPVVTPTATPTNTPTNTPSSTPTNTATSTPSSTPTPTEDIYNPPTLTPTSIVSPTATPTLSPTATPTGSPTATATSTPLSEPSPTATATVEPEGFAINFATGAPGSVFVFIAPDLPAGAQARIAVRGPTDSTFADLLTLSVPDGGTLVFVLVTLTDDPAGTYTIRLTVDSGQTGLAQDIVREQSFTLDPDAPVRTERPADAPTVPLEPAQTENQIFLPFVVR
jgi:hypothetical protein